MHELSGVGRGEDRIHVLDLEQLGLDRGVLALRRTPAEWVTAGAGLARQVAQALGDAAIAVEHIGSTAVPGLLAKPVIDLVVGVHSSVSPKKVERTLVRCGWKYRGDAGEEGGHVFVLERRPSFRVAHLHVVDYDGDQWRRYLKLLDRLRTDPSARAMYDATKLALVARFGDNNRGDYTAGKTATVMELIDG